MVSLVYAMELLGTQQPQGWLTAGLLALGTATFLFALHHFRHTTWPMIRLDAMSVPTFRVTLYGGSLFRASISAVPFLLPLMFRRFWHERFSRGFAGSGGVCGQSDDKTCHHAVDTLAGL